jgi:hypothetical protein
LHQQELICFVAPGAQLYFHSAALGEAAFAQAILNLSAAGCNIIVDDVTYSAEPAFSQGLIAQAVEVVKAQGVAYFAAAGNFNNLAYEASADWVEDASSSKVLHNIGGSGGAVASLELSVHPVPNITYPYYLQV